MDDILKNEPAYVTATANWMLKSNEMDQAIPLLMNALAIHPDDFLLHYTLGRAHDLSVYHIETDADRDHIEQAAIHYSVASDMKPQDARAAFFAATMHMKLAHDDDAMKFACRATDINKNDSHAWLRRGQIFERRGDRINAITCYQNTVIIQPGHHKAQDALTRLKVPAPSIGCKLRDPVYIAPDRRPNP